MKEILNETQREQLQASLQEHPLKVPCLLALETGMRRDELLDLRWQDIDLPQHIIRVRNSKQTGTTYSVTLSAAMTALLLEHRAQQEKEHAQAGTHEGATALVCTDEQGQRLTARRLLDTVRTCCLQAGLPKLSFHDLRSATWKRLRAQHQGKERT